MVSRRTRARQPGTKLRMKPQREPVNTSRLGEGTGRMRRNGGVLSHTSTFHNGQFPRTTQRSIIEIAPPRGGGRRHHPQGKRTENSTTHKNEGRKQHNPLWKDVFFHPSLFFHVCHFSFIHVFPIFHCFSFSIFMFFHWFSFLTFSSFNFHVSSFL